MEVAFLSLPFLATHSCFPGKDYEDLLFRLTRLVVVSEGAGGDAELLRAPKARRAVSQSLHSAAGVRWGRLRHSGNTKTTR